MKEQKKTKIYITYASGGYSSFSGMNYIGYAVDLYDENSDKLNSLCSHLSSSIGFVQLDMGYIMNDHNGIGKGKHEIYTEAHPEGYELIWFGECDNDSQFNTLKQMLIDAGQIEHSK